MPRMLERDTSAAPPPVAAGERPHRDVVVKDLAIETDVPRVRRVAGRFRVVLRVVVPLLLLLAWQLSSRPVSHGSFQLPSPYDVALGFRDLWQNGSIQSAIPASLRRAAIGFVVGAAAGIAFGVAVGVSRLLDGLLDTSFQMARVVPFIALLPLFQVWFGIDEAMKVIFIAVACVFPAYLNTVAAVRQVDPKLVEAGRTFSLGRGRIVTQVVLPAALPGILVGVRYAMGVALLALIVAEQVNAGAGIGYIIFVADGALRLDLMIVGILLYAALGLVVDIVMRLVERFATPWLGDARA